MDSLRQFSEVSKINFVQYLLALILFILKSPSIAFGDFDVSSFKFQDTTRQGFSPGFTSLSQKGLGSELQIA